MKTRTVIAIVGAGIGAHIILTELKKRMPDIHVVDKLPMNYNAVTIPPIGIFILKGQAGNQDLLNHEMIHWKQYQESGLFPYYYNYMKGMIVNGYDLHPMEQEARANEDPECRTNYTACVRGGQARTVYNPTFRT